MCIDGGFHEVYACLALTYRTHDNLIPFGLLVGATADVRLNISRCHCRMACTASIRWHTRDSLAYWLSSTSRDGALRLRPGGCSRREEVSRLESLTKEVYMFEEVAELLGVNVNTLYRWRKEGRMSAYKPAEGQQYRVRREEVARLLGRTHEPVDDLGRGYEG